MATSKAVKLSLQANNHPAMTFLNADNRAFSCPDFSVGCLVCGGIGRLFFTHIFTV
jgi:hypothetical protein